MADNASTLRATLSHQQSAPHGTEEDANGYYEDDNAGDSKPKKKRRIIKPADKKFECPADDCGKSYSRAEHLYRHQLNHAPKQIYHCDHPGCDRHFVRADLCARHKERHTAKGSHLQRKDAFANNQNAQTVARDPESPPSANGVTQIASPPPASSNDVPSRNVEGLTSRSGQSYSTESDQHCSDSLSSLAPVTSNGSMSVDSGVVMGGQNQYHPYSNESNGQSRLPGLQSPVVTRTPFQYSQSTSQHPQHTLAYPQNQVNQGISIMNTMPSLNPPLTSPPVGTLYPAPQLHSPSGASLRSSMGYSNQMSLPAYGYSQEYSQHGTSRPTAISPPAIHVPDQCPVPNSRPNSLADMNLIDQMNSGFAMPVFGHEGFDRSPSVLMDDTFLNSLFGTTALDVMDPSPPGPEFYRDANQQNAPAPNTENDGLAGENPLLRRSRDSAAGINLLDIDLRESLINKEKHRRLINLVHGWHAIEDNPNRRRKEDILRGSTDEPNHVLSLTMLKTYITSYWVHIHCQMPILHRPTFNPETCPDLLLLAMMCLGASCLERTHGYDLTRDSAELAFFVAYHIRWEVFKDPEFRPAAKLWTFQTMLLLELFEKMYSTRSLHERAHIHHATTLTVMRRGSSLIGRSATEMHLNESDPTRTPPGPDGSINASGQNTPDAYWNRWITAEATRRAAFAAFIIDSTHATLFGHSAVMSPHDLRLSLPCDEALWSATSSAEVQRVEASLAANGFKTSTFLDGLKRTLNGQRVRTNTFGRVILMSGLLNVSYHMNQRDLQVSSLGAASTLGSHLKWRSPLTRAFDFWRRDFDDSISQNEHWLQICNHKSIDGKQSGRKDHIFESRTCLHSLAHMAMHVEITDCLVFAGAKDVLGRIVMDSDRAVMQRRMREQWAPSARARDATFYALRFLCEVLIPEEILVSKDPSATFTYSSRDDYLLNRPWTLYFALLIVWSYGYALEGPLRSSPEILSTRELQIQDMQRFLIRMGGVASPEDLDKVENRNSCLGLLLLLRESFQQPRWELLHDANEVLGSCIDFLIPGNGAVYHKQQAGIS